MLPINPFILIFNACALALSLAFLLMVLWYDAKAVVNQLFALFLCFMVLWNLGVVLGEAGKWIDSQGYIVSIGNFVSHIGYVASNAILYALIIKVIGLEIRFFRPLATLAVVVIISYNAFLIVNDTTLVAEQAPPVNPISILLFSIVSLALLWRYRQNNISYDFMIGSLIVIAGQVANLLNASLGLSAVASSIASFGSLIMGTSIIRQTIIWPLRNRESQIKAIHEVNVAITKRATETNALDEIAIQAAKWLQADAVGIFKSSERQMRLVASYQLPERLLNYSVPYGETIVGRLATENQTIFIRQYNTQSYSDEMQLSDIFLDSAVIGSVIAVPLTYDQDIIGGLVIISGRYGKVFQLEDVRQSELLAAQAAVSISVNDLFLQQKSLLQSLTEAHHQLQGVISSTENPVLAVNRALELTFANTKAQEILQLEPEDEGKPIYKLLDIDVIPTDFRNVIRAARRHETYMYSLSVADREYMCHIGKLGDQRIEGWVGVLNDVTELKELDRVKSEMIRMTSHDLKNPIQAAIANLDLLRDDIDSEPLEGESKTEINLSLDNIERQLNNMHRIISGILDLERVRASGLHGDVCSARDVAFEAVDQLMLMARAKNVTLKLNIGASKLSFVGDQTQFERALVNVIENAIKFTPEYGRVDVDVYNDDDDILFSVTDTGIGIPEEMQTHIFERFYRGEQPGAEHISGTGLGLSLVRTVIEKHAGRIWLKSQSGQGTTFFIAVPQTTPDFLTPEA
ncbi:GAF domain-containing protein [Phototrophicus methaneseepsis]|uniref:histidine kinase n=1 Tax=Phototrophicus methaneseepsis TaxID=2710758 RepID=A0A7S8E6G9_9CHLR|nr:ATP-binding protein [Phototrophicus methaneseepsis]QPC81200.1 GAF domain-containing protein [Phototrophicus methaneseepsis]